MTQPRTIPRRGPAPGTGRDTSSVENMRRAWGENAPDWIVRLASECDAPGSSQTLVARKLKISGSIISGAIRKTYKGNLKGVEDAVKGVFFKETVDCPIDGDIPKEACASRRSQRKMSTANPLGVAIARHCPGCKHNKPDGGSHVEP